MVMRENIVIGDFLLLYENIVFRHPVGIMRMLARNEETNRRLQSGYKRWPVTARRELLMRYQHGIALGKTAWSCEKVQISPFLKFMTSTLGSISLQNAEMLHD